LSAAQSDTAVRLYGHQQQIGEHKVYRYGLLDDPHPRTEAQRRAQRAITRRSLVRLCLEAGKPTPTTDAEVVQALRGCDSRTARTVERIFADNATSGAEWMRDIDLPELEREALGRLGVASLFPRRDFPAGVSSVNIPYRSGNLTMYRHNAPAADDPANDPLSSWSTAERTVTPESGVVATQIHRDAQEDSVIPILPDVQDDMIRAMAFAEDNTIISGDSNIASPWDTAIASWDARGRMGSSHLGTSLDHRARWDGLRKLAASTHSNSTDQSGAQTEAGLLDAVVNLDVEHLIPEQGDAGVGVLVSPEYFFGTMLDSTAFANFATWENRLPRPGQRHRLRQARSLQLRPHLLGAHMGLGNDIIALSIRMEESAGTDEEHGTVIPDLGDDWYLEELWIVPDTTTSEDASNYTTLTVKKGLAGTVLATRDTDSAGDGDLTAGTAVKLTMAATATEVVRRFSGGDELYLEKDDSGTGAAFDGCCLAVFRRVA